MTKDHIPEWKKPFLNDKVTWIIDSSIIDYTPSSNLPEIIRNLGHSVILHYVDKNRPSTFNIDYMLDTIFIDEGTGPIIAYGCQNFIKRVKSEPWYPGTYPSQWLDDMRAILDTRIYMSKIPLDLFFNSNSIFVPISFLITSSAYLFELFKANELFVKDDVAFKQFPAKIVTKDNISEYLEVYKSTQNIDASSFVLVSTKKPIDSEHRFIIVDNKIVSHSTYMLNNEIIIYNEVPQKAIDFVNEILHKINISSDVYALDIAISNDIPKILEINSFSCAGLYACNLEEIVKAVSAKASADFLKDEW